MHVALFLVLSLTYNLGVGFVPVRKKGKLPFKTISEKMNLEYGSSGGEIHNGQDLHRRDGAARWTYWRHLYDLLPVLSATSTFWQPTEDSPLSPRRPSSRRLSNPSINDWLSSKHLFQCRGQFAASLDTFPHWYRMFCGVAISTNLLVANPVMRWRCRQHILG